MGNRDKDQEVRSGTSTSNEGNNIVWKTCPMCERGGSKSPEFKEFMPRIRHLVEHATGFPPNRELFYPSDDLDELEAFLRAQPARTDAKTVHHATIMAAKPYLPLIAEWLQPALEELPQLKEIRDAGVMTADELCRLVGSLPDGFEEQKTYLLSHRKTLRTTGQDADWPKKDETRAKFVADSMAGAEFRLAPSTSREYIRQQRPRSRPRRDTRKHYERLVRRPDGRISTARNDD